ncbi:hypothetical protein F4781DRAFT_299138 [Annulohypoxylon bovei var. microspora]|nr:hypothetical protein F4781DRAFT_299138 [Annulohypoxylon bovei var. microspora]
MPGLTLNTEGAVSRTPIYPPSHLTSQSLATSTTTPTTTATTATPSAPANPTPTQNAGASAHAHSPTRSSSPPQRPPYSPITPPLNPIALPPRPSYTHTSQPPHQTSIAPPPPEPIDFDANPDVLALKSAISVLQLQRRKAAADMGVLSRAKAAALADPAAFVQDLTSGRVAVEGEGFGGGGGRDSSDSESSEDDEDEDMEDADVGVSAAGQPAPSGASSSSAQTNTDTTTTTTNTPIPPPTVPHSGIKPEPGATAIPHQPAQPQAQPNRQPPRPWAKLPKPQNIVRCPPINWSQYAVVGESLDKLHAEQVSRPTQGVPAVVAPDGRYEFGAATGKQERLVGVAAPYAPGKDRIDRRSKGPRR